MKVIYNSRLLSNQEVPIDISNRAFCYGDGLFETIVTGPDRLNLIDHHIDRIVRACEVLNMTPPPIDGLLVEEMINQLKKENELEGVQRSKLQVWRNGGGLYTPKIKQTSFLLSTVNQEKPFYQSIDSLGLCGQSTVQKTGISFAKTISALPYVLAGVEKAQSRFDDLILLNVDGFIAETIASNIFWVMDGEIYTPSLQTGCVEGVMRKHLLEAMRKAGVSCQEVLAESEALLNANYIFTTNASGITWVRSYLDSKQLEAPTTILKSFIKLPPLP